MHAAPANWRHHALIGDAGQQLRQRAVAAPPFRAQELQRRRSALRTRAAMFDGLSRSLEKAWDSVRKDGKLTAENIKGPLRDIRWVLEEVPALCAAGMEALLLAERGLMWPGQQAMQGAAADPLCCPCCLTCKRLERAGQRICCLPAAGLAPSPAALLQRATVP